MNARRSISRWWTIISLCLWSGLLVSSRAQTSFNGTYRLSSELTARTSEDPKEERTRVYSVRDESGRVVARVVRAIPYDIPAPIPAVLEDGRVMLVHTYDAIAEIFDRSGGLQRRVALLDPPTPDYERIIKVAPLRESLMLGVSDANGSAVEVLSVSGAGEVVRTARFPDARATGIAVDGTTGLSVVATESWDGPSLHRRSWFIPSVGDTWSIDAGWSDGEFSRSGPSRFLGWSAAGVHVIDISSRTIEWSKTSAADELVLDAVFDGTEVFLLNARRPVFDEGKWIFENAVLSRCASDGRVLSTSSIMPRQFSKASIQGTPGSRYIDVDGMIVR